MWLPESGGELSALLVNAVLLALWAALPGLILGYIRQVLAARNIRPEFALRKSEISELDRAVALYDQVCRRLETIEQQAETPTRLWRALFDRADDDRDADAEERDDLQAHAQHLRGTIARLKRRPLQRLHAWVHAASARSALAGAIAAYGVALALAIAASQAPGQAAWADELNAGARMRSSGIRSMRACSTPTRLPPASPSPLPRCFICCAARVCAATTSLKFARSRIWPIPIRSGRPSRRRRIRRLSTRRNGRKRTRIMPNDTWFAVLGLSPAATIEDVRDAYKTLIKQNHPDRVHGMAPVFRALAEAETKKINAAYRQALVVHPARRNLYAA